MKLDIQSIVTLSIAQACANIGAYYLIKWFTNGHNWISKNLEDLNKK